MENKNGNLPDQTTMLAFTRTRFAADRTLMSWIRTSISMISFGFAMIKFFQYIKPMEKGHTHGADPKRLGAILIILGILSLVPAIREHRKMLKAVSVSDKGPTWSFSLIVAFIVALIGVLAFIDAILVRIF